MISIASAKWFSKWIADGDVQVVITTGGTGLTGRDGTPEAVTPLLDKVIDGFGEMFRVLSYETIGTSTLQSRTIAGVANGTFIFCLPGSTGACMGWLGQADLGPARLQNAPLQSGGVDAEAA